MWQILELVTHRGETPLIKRDLGTSQWFFSKLVTNCKGPHTINTANVGSTRNTCCGNACFGAQVSSKYGTWSSERVILQFMGVGSLAGVTYLRYTVLTSSNKSETAVHFCDPALSVLVMLVSRNIFHVVSALQSFAFIHILFWLIRSLVDPTSQCLSYAVQSS